MTIEQYKKARRLMMKIRGAERAIARVQKDEPTKIHGLQLTKADSKRIVKNALKEAKTEVAKLESEFDKL